MQLELRLGEGHATTMPRGGRSVRSVWTKDNVFGLFPPFPKAAVFPNRESLSRAEYPWLKIRFFSNGAACAGTLKSVRPAVEKPAHSSACVMAYALLFLPTNPGAPFAASVIK